MTVSLSKEVFNYPENMVDPYQMGECAPTLQGNDWIWQQSLGSCGMAVETEMIDGESYV